jgi:hypothetical protein
MLPGPVGEPLRLTASGNQDSFSRNQNHLRVTLMYAITSYSG